MEQSRYIDLTTDFGFKRVFGTDVNSEFLISLLNGLFRGRKEIRDIVYNRNEHVGDGEGMGTVIFDLTCTGSDGERFVIEVQRTSQDNLKRRMLYYGSKMISDQAPKGSRRGWNYGISEVYVVVLMDGFAMPDHRPSAQFLHDICLCDRDSGSVFYEDLGFIYVELLKFNKLESELENDLDQWLFVLKNLSKQDKLSVYLRKPIFQKLFEIAEYSKLNEEDRKMYDVSLKRKWDAESIRTTAINEQERARQRGLEEGRQEGREEGRQEGLQEGRQEERAKAEVEKRDSAIKMLQNGFDVKLISDIIGLPIEEIEKLK